MTKIASAPGAAVILVITLTAAAFAAPATAAPKGTAAPVVQGRAALVMDADTGEVLYRKRPDAELPIASTTKLMTALLALERTRLSDRIAAVPYRPMPAESIIGLKPGERLTVKDLLYGLLLASANDAAETIAERVGGTERGFVRLMNTRARELGLSHTHYANPVGLDDPGNYSSALDLALLARKLREHSVFRRIVDTPRAELTSGAADRRVTTRNTLLLRNRFVDGIKTGHTLQAGWSLVGSATRRGVHLISVVLGAPAESVRNADTLELLNYGFSQYTTMMPVRRGARLAAVNVRYRDEEVALLAPRALRVMVRRGASVGTRVGAPTEVKETTRTRPIGTVSVRVDGRTLKSERLYPAKPVPAAGTLLIAYKKLRWPLTVLLAVAILVIAVQRRRRRLRQLRERRRQRRFPASRGAGTTR